MNMLSFETCQRLKTSGFPQGRRRYDNFGRDERGDTIYANGKLWEYRDGWVLRPTIENLLKALGEDFRGLEVGDWPDEDKSVIYYAKSKAELIVDGHTPEEALCNLYLALRSPQ